MISSNFKVTFRKIRKFRFVRIRTGKRSLIATESSGQLMDRSHYSQMITLANEEINGFRAEKERERVEKRGNEALLWLTTCAVRDNPSFSSLRDNLDFGFR